MLIEGWQTGDGKTFFAVGDPMQSIYRFRDADVSIFNDSIEVGVADTQLTHCQLQANFRSAPAVVDWCNELFSSVFAGGRTASLGEVPFSPAVAMLDDMPVHPLTPVVSLIFPDTQAETNFLLVNVDDATKRYEQLKEKGIVVRNRSKQPLCENMLRITVGTKRENQKLIQALKELSA